MSVALQTYRFTVDQYRQMGEAGIFPPDCRVELGELVDGEIFEMSPIGPWHAGVVSWLTERFVIALAGRAIVHAQNPTELDTYSEPQPDIMLLRPRADFYRTAHPIPADTFLLIEVVDTGSSSVEVAARWCRQRRSRISVSRSTTFSADRAGLIQSERAASASVALPVTTFSPR